MTVKFPFPLVIPDLIDDWTPAYRWDKPGSPYYELRPDRSVPAVAVSPVGAAIRSWFDLHPLLPDIGIMHDVSQGLVHPVAASPTRTTKKASPAASERVGGRPSSAHGRRKQTSVSARGKCPKGHYWSYKQKKCVKSKF